MAVTSKAFFRGSASTSNTTLYTAPNTSTAFVVTNIVVTNTATSSATFTLNVDAVAIASATTIAANSIAMFDVKQVVPASDPAKTISGSASATTVNFHISGVEVA